METIARNGNYQDSLSNFYLHCTATCNLRQHCLHCVETMNLPLAVLRRPYNKAHSVGPSSERPATSGVGTVKTPQCSRKRKTKGPTAGSKPFLSVQLNALITTRYLRGHISGTSRYILDISCWERVKDGS